MVGIVLYPDIPIQGSLFVDLNVDTPNDIWTSIMPPFSQWQKLLYVLAV